MEYFQLQIIQQNGKNTVNARALWDHLKVETKFAMWIDRRLSESLAVENVDFTRAQNWERDNQLFTEKEYYLTVDKACEICMLERTEIGRKIRQYFIDEKKRLIEIEKGLSIEEMTVKVLSHFQEKIKELEATLKDQAPAVEFHQAVNESAGAITFQDFGRVIGIGRNNLFDLCRSKKILDNKNQPYQQYINQGYFKLVEKLRVVKGKSEPYFQTLITGKGQTWLERVLKGGE